MIDEYDVIVIGGGPAGYVAAIRCAQHGKKVACVEKWITDGQPMLGGTCLNVGCIPSKALLESSEHYASLKNKMGIHGIGFTNLSLDLAQMHQRKNKMVSELTKGIASLFKYNKITWLQGQGCLLNDKQIKVTDKQAHETTYKAQAIIIASGSEPVNITAAPIDNDKITDSTGALAFTEVPPKLAIIGAGVIGLELGSVWARLGSDVVLLEAQKSFLAIADQQVSREALRHYTEQGLDIHLGARVIEASADKKVTVRYEDKKGITSLIVDKLIVAVGRKPNTEALFTAESGLMLDERGFLLVDEQCKTNIPDIYAIGDVVRGPMLAHKGSEEGMMVADIIVGKAATLNYDLIPSVIYTDPEIAWVGETEESLIAGSIDYTKGVFPFAASGRAKAMDKTIGFCKILADKKTDRLLGMHIMGHNASELIMEGVIAMEFGASSEDIARITHPHPTLAEVVHESALAVNKRKIHGMNR